MKNKFILVASTLLFIFNFTMSQTLPWCATMDNLSLKQGLYSSASYTIPTPSSQMMATTESNTKVITIPVVFHIVYRTSTENISDSKINDQIASLNADFRKLNLDISILPAPFAAVAADCQIQFCLAKRDPQGNPTTGIERRLTTISSFTYLDSKVKNFSQGGLDPWPYSSYLNIWVCNLSGSLGGWATFPGSPPLNEDGVVVDYQWIGNDPYGGRITTHELGHWLNLLHIWGGPSCNDDLITDTPLQTTDNLGPCPTYPHFSSCPGNAPTGDMFYNYMDYTGCLRLFTKGQKARMRASIFYYRSSLLNSLGCIAPNTPICASAPTGLNVTSITTTSAKLNWTAMPNVTSYIVQYKNTTSINWLNASPPNNTVTIVNLTSGIYTFKVRAVCGSTMSPFSLTNNFTIP